jgi:DNA-directed RNA polymerase specialized sigma24 family protein
MTGKVTPVNEFEEHRAHLRSVAYRMLGSLSEAEDAVQEAWLRMDRADVTDVRNMRGWLTTVVARICLDMLRARIRRCSEHGQQHAVEEQENGGRHQHANCLDASTLPAAALGPLRRDDGNYL